MKTLGQAIAAVGMGEGVLAKLGGRLGSAARVAAIELGALPEEIARAKRTAWAAAARTALPEGSRGVHPSWFEHALEGMPARTREDLAAAGGRDAVGTWLTRIASAGIPPLPTADLDKPPRSLSGVGRMTPEALVKWLSHVGADQLAVAMAAAGSEALALAIRAGGEIVKLAVARVTQAPRAGHLGQTRAAIVRSRLPLDGKALVLIGARALAPHAADAPLLRRQIAARLNRDLGLAVLAELDAYSTSAVAHAPDWLALSAPLR